MASRFTSSGKAPFPAAALLLLLSWTAHAQDSKALWVEAQSALKAGRYESAESHYREFVKQQPGVGEGWANLGLTLHLQKKRDAAIPAFERALKLNPALLHAQLFLGISLFDGNRAAQAEPVLKRYAAAAPVDPQGHYYLGLTLATAGSLQAAMHSFERAAELAPRNVDILYHLAQNYIVQANALTLRASTADAKIPIIKRWQQTHSGPMIEAARPFDSGEARQSLKDLAPRLDRTPLDLEAEQQAAVALANLHLATTKKFHAIEPNGFRIHQLLAGYYEQTNQRELAIMELKTVLAMNPNVRGMHLALGAIYKDSSQPELAVEQFKAELAIGSPDLAARLQLAQTYLMLDKPTEALAELHLYKSTSVADPLLYRTLGKVYTSLGRLDLAEANYEKAISIGDRDRGTYYQLGQVYRRLGKAELARQAFDATDRAMQDQLASDRIRINKAIEAQKRERKR